MQTAKALTKYNIVLNPNSRERYTPKTLNPKPGRKRVFKNNLNPKPLTLNRQTLNPKPWTLTLHAIAKALSPRALRLWAGQAAMERIRSAVGCLVLFHKRWGPRGFKV